jgi:hypothetical protein
MICLLISIIATSFSFVNANDNFAVNNDTFENTHRNLETDPKTKTASANKKAVKTVPAGPKGDSKNPVNANANSN